MSNKLIYCDPAIEKIHAKQKVCANEPDEYSAGFNNGLLVATAVLHLEPAAMEQKWVRTEDELPAPNKTVEMFFPISNTVCIGFYYLEFGLEEWCIGNERGIGRPCEIDPTYWRYRDPSLIPKLQ